MGRRETISRRARANTHWQRATYATGRARVYVCAAVASPCGPRRKEQDRIGEREKRKFFFSNHVRTRGRRVRVCVCSSDRPYVRACVRVCAPTVRPRAVVRAPRSRSFLRGCLRAAPAAGRRGTPRAAAGVRRLARTHTLGGGGGSGPARGARRRARARRIDSAQAALAPSFHIPFARHLVTPRRFCI